MMHQISLPSALFCCKSDDGQVPPAKRPAAGAVRLCVLLLCCCILCGMAGGTGWAAVAMQRPPQWAQPVQAEGLPNLHRVSGKLYRSAQPTAEGMRAAERLGIRTVVSLRSGQRDASLAVGTDLILRHVPMRAWNPHFPAAVAALSAIAVSPGPVLVHCWHGADRTGMVVALYRMVEQGWTREAAIQEMLEGGYGYHSIWKDIITFLETVDVEALRQALRANAALPCLSPEGGTLPADGQEATRGGLGAGFCFFLAAGQRLRPGIRVW